MLSGLFKSRQSILQGGPIGSRAEAATPSLSNPNYDAAYLAYRLGAKNPNPSRPFDETIRDRFQNDATSRLPLAEKMVYLMNATKEYDVEAEECLKEEFKLWLAGMHPDNKTPRKYTNQEGGLTRRNMRGKELTDWHPTWWGNRQLTHLPGVREYLRGEMENSDIIFSGSKRLVYSQIFQSFKGAAAPCEVCGSMWIAIGYDILLLI